MKTNNTIDRMRRATTFLFAPAATAFFRSRQMFTMGYGIKCEMAFPTQTIFSS